MFELQLSRDQHEQVMLSEIEYQLTTMKQYLTVEETKAYLLLLKRYGGLWDREYVLDKYHKAWGDTIEQIS